MGTKCAPSFADLYMAWFENKFIYTSPLQPLTWVRFLDDCFCIWTRGQAELDKFLNHLNSCHPTIKFTMEASNTKVNFLDTTVYKENNQLFTDLYCKPTDSHNYLLYSSAHPQKCKNSIPYGQFLRIRRICTKLEDFDKHVIEFGKHFIRRDYPMHLIEEAAIKARRPNRDNLLQNSKKETNKDQKNILVTTYHPNDNTLPNLVHENWDLLGRNTNTLFLHKDRPMVAYRRPPNLKDLLVKADVSTRAKKPPSKGKANTINFPSQETPELQETNWKQTSIRSFFKLTKKDVETTPTNIGENTQIQSLNKPKRFPRQTTKSAPTPTADIVHT